MGRIRTIKPEFFLHEHLYDLEKTAKLPVRLAFAGLWCQADRDGRFAWRPRRLKTQILPYDDLDFEMILNFLVDGKFVQKYEVAGKIYGLIPTFHDHQVINHRESKSNIPSPLMPRHTQESTGHAHDLYRGEREGKGKGKERNNPPTPLGGGKESNVEISSQVDSKEIKSLTRSATQGLGTPPEFDRSLEPLWEALTAIQTEARPDASKMRLTASRRYTLAAARQEFSDPELENGWKWLMTSENPKALNIRKGSRGIDTFLRSENTAAYVELATDSANWRSEAETKVEEDPIAQWKAKRAREIEKEKKQELKVAKA